MLHQPQELSANFANMACQTMFDTCIPDHYPICANLDCVDRKNASNHTDPILFNLPLVKEEVAKIWNYFFNLGITPAKAWSLAIKSTESLLICIKIGMQKIREKRKKNLTMQVEELEKRANNGSISDQIALRKARASLNRILNRELEEKGLFLGNGGQGRLIVLCLKCLQCLRSNTLLILYPL